MRRSHAFLRDCLLIAPAVIVGAAASGGAELAVRATLAVGLIVAHLAWSQRATAAVVHAVANGGAASAASTASMVARMTTLLPLAAALVVLAGPTATALAVGCVVGGATLFAAGGVLARRDARVSLGSLGSLVPVREESC